MQGAAFAIIGALTAYSLLCREEEAKRRAIVGSLLIVLLVHAGFNREVSIAALICLFAINAVGALRGGVNYPPRWVAILLLWIFAFGSVSSLSLHNLAVPIATWGALFFFAGNVATISSDYLRCLRPVVAIVVVINFASAINERIFGHDAVWPRRDGTTLRVDGVNNLWQGAGGRALGTMGWAITLGEAMALLLTASLWIWWRCRERRWLLVSVAAALTLVLSGTRSALIMLLIAATIVILAISRRVVVVVPTVLIALAGLAASTFNLANALGFSAASENTISVRHRQAVWEAVPGLLTDRPLHEVLLGSGYDSGKALLTSGAIPNAGGVGVYDNEIVRSLIGIGVIGIILAIIATLDTLKHGGLTAFSLAAAAIVGGSAYDVLTWPSLTYLLFFFWSCRPAEHENTKFDKKKRDTGHTEPAQRGLEVSSFSRRQYSAGTASRF